MWDFGAVRLVVVQVHNGPEAQVNTSSERRFVVVGGRPSWRRVALSVAGAAGVMSLVFAVAYASSAMNTSSPLVAVGVFVAMVLFYAPALCASAWWITMPGIAGVGLAVAMGTHRFRLQRTNRAPQQRHSRWHRARRAALAVVVVCGVWTITVGALMIPFVIAGN